MDAPNPKQGWEGSDHDDATNATDAFDGTGDDELEDELDPEMRDKVDLLRTLKGMGRRFAWRGAMKAFHTAKAEGVVADNNVYRLEWVYYALVYVAVVS